MRQNFEDWWECLPNRIPAGTVINAWSQLKDDLPGEFTFKMLDNDWSQVVIENPSRNIAKYDFKWVYGFWEEYCRGVLARSKINEGTVNSTYIISILHWLDKHPKARLIAAPAGFEPAT